MPDKEIERKYHEQKVKLAETYTRIRRYSLDPRLKEGQPGEAGAELRRKVDAAWADWLKLRDEFVTLPASPTSEQLNPVERAWLMLERQVDLVQRELIAEESFKAGLKTVAWLAVVLLGLSFIYLWTHGVRGLDFSAFEPWPEWGPLKYGEVAFWSSFGVLCAMLGLATWYLTRRDFDKWYQPWYISAALRAPFLTVILMMVVLEFVEWYGEGKWIQTYLLEEGNKFYFIVFMSFCLGLTSDTTSNVMSDLAEGVGEFVQRAVGKVSQRLAAAVSNVDLPKR